MTGLYICLCDDYDVGRGLHTQLRIFVQSYVNNVFVALCMTSDVTLQVISDQYSAANRGKSTPYHTIRYVNKKAVLSQRWPRNAPYTWVPWKFSGLPDYAYDYYSQHFSWTFVPIDTVNVATKFEVRSFTRSWDNRGYPKKFGQSLDKPTLHFLQNF